MVDSLAHAVRFTTPQKNALITAGIIVGLMLVRWVVLFIVRRRTTDVRSRYHARKLASYTLVVIGLLLIGRVWFTGFRSLATFFGLMAAGVAVALRDPIVNMAGWLFILWRRPFMAGDRIQIGSSAGDVIDVRLLQFTLLEIGNWVAADQSTGRMIHVPNGRIFTESLANYTSGFPYIWNELPVLVTFESNWEDAKQILQGIADRRAEHLSEEAEETVLRASRRFMIFYSTLTPTVYTSVQDSGILLTIRYLCEARRRRGSAHALWEEILREFAGRDDIDFAYPTARFYDNVREGKPDARAEPDNAERTTGGA